MILPGLCRYFLSFHPLPLIFLAFMPQFSCFSHPRHAAFPSFTLLPLSSRLPLPFPLFLITPHLPHLVVSSHLPPPPHAFICLPPLLTLHPLSATVSLLSCLQPFPLIPAVSSYPAFRLSFHPFPVCHFSYFIACHSQFCLNSEQTATFQSQQATLFSVPFIIQHRVKKMSMS